MPNRILRIKDYSISSDDVFFFDNNVWMNLLCPIGNFNQKKQASYSKLFSYILSRKNPIFTNSLVLSEFSNRYLKLAYDLDKKNNKNFKSSNYKEWRRTTEFAEAVQDVQKYLKKIIQNCNRCSDEFNAINIDNIMGQFINIGFNDAYYIELSIRKSWKIVTDDSDFTIPDLIDKNLTIITE